MHLTESDILRKLDLACKGQPDEDYPTGNLNDIKYNFFLDLEHGYVETAGSRIHLYADSTRWIIVFEKSGYQNRGSSAGIELDYIGNCVDYIINEHEGHRYISNSSDIPLITADEYDRISEKQGHGSELTELINPVEKDLIIHGRKVTICHDLKKYLELGIKPRELDNPRQLLGHSDIVRFLTQTNPELTNATEEEVRQHIPHNIPKLMTIDKFHFTSAYDEQNPPSNQETYRLIAKILVTKDTAFWKPTLKPNNHWRNWESGNL